MIDKIKQYLDQLNERERRAVIAAAIAFLLFIPYQFIWKPFSNSLNDLEERVDRQQKDLVWMQDKVNEVRQLSRAGAATAGTGQPVYATIEATARQKFGGDIRVQQEGKGGVRVTMKNAAFDDVMTWLDDLTFQHHINVKEFKVDREAGAGRVNASILIES